MIDEAGEYENKVFNEDVFKILDSLPDESIDLIYGDPDYNVGIRYNNKSYTNFNRFSLSFIVDLQNRQKISKIMLVHFKNIFTCLKRFIVGYLV